MGQATLQVEISAPKGQTTETLDFVVDSGAACSVAPEAVLNRLGIRPVASQRAFPLANGSALRRSRGIAMFRYVDSVGEDWVVFGGEGDVALLGPTTIQAMGLVLDPLKRELKPMPMPLGGYEMSIVIYLDVLGFSDMVHDAATAEAIFATLRSLRDDAPRGSRFYTVSDTAVLWVPLHRGSESQEMADAMEWTRDGQRKILQEHCMMTRGGVARGWSAHSESSGVYGPALNAAHRMESTMAFLPRVIMDPAAVPLEWQARFLDDRLSKVVCLNDGTWFLDYLVDCAHRACGSPADRLRTQDGSPAPSREPEVAAWTKVIELLRSHRKAVTRYAESAKSPNQLARCAWAYFLHNSTVRRFMGPEEASEPDNHVRELESLLISEADLAVSQCSKMIIPAIPGTQ